MVKEMAVNSPWADYSVEPIALAGEDGTAPLYVLQSAVNSSLRAPNPDFIKRYGMTGFNIIKTMPVHTTTFDSLLFGAGRAANCQGEFIKLDTQSTEADILRGATRTLDKKTVALLVEVEFYEIYKGQPLFSEVEIQFAGLDSHFTDSISAPGRQKCWRSGNLPAGSERFMLTPYSSKTRCPVDSGKNPSASVRCMFCLPVPCFWNITILHCN